MIKQHIIINILCGEFKKYGCMTMIMYNVPINDLFYLFSVRYLMDHCLQCIINSKNSY